MKKISIILGTVITLAVTGVIACNSGKTASTNNEGEVNVKGISENESSENAVRRGQYLVTIMGCNDCHSPKIMTPHGPDIDSTRMLSGHPASVPVPKINAGELQNWVLFSHNLTTFVGPWGVSFAANLTSDATGIGNWTEGQFLNAIRHGKYKGLENSRDLLPPMPWVMYKNATDEDLKAIFAYLKSTPPVQNRVPGPIAPDQLAKHN
ncbi:MAG TPA: c-type cytochrome [Flavisolibacter sp.]|nr:c-type cytochrome [Flavisolibacter sp.]